MLLILGGCKFTEQTVGDRVKFSLFFGVFNGDDVSDLVSCSLFVTISLSSIRAAAAVGFATGIRVLLDQRFALDEWDLSSVLYIVESGFGIEAMSASRIDDFIFVGKWKRFIFFGTGETGYESRRVDLDTSKFVGVRWIEGREDDEDEEGE